VIKNIRPRLAEAGKIKIGGLGEERKSKKGSTWRPPVKFDHFVVTKTTRDARGDLEVDTALMDALAAGCAEPIREIPIVLHADDIDSVFPTSYALYTSRTCACRGDGEHAIRREIKDGKATGAEKQIACPCPYLRADSGPVCKPNGKLYCSIAVPGSALAGAVHVWRTTSIISVEQMIGSLAQIRAVCGTLRGIPLWLRLRPVQVQPAGGTATTVYCCHVELRAADLAEVQAAALRAAKVRSRLGASDDEYRRLLAPPGVSESDDEQASIEAEFYADADADESQDDGRGAAPSDIAAALDAKAASAAAETGDGQDGQGRLPY
jgi:hypothetical protein